MANEKKSTTTIILVVIIGVVLLVLAHRLWMASTTYDTSKVPVMTESQKQAVENLIDKGWIEMKANTVYVDPHFWAMADKEARENLLIGCAVYWANKAGATYLKSDIYDKVTKQHLASFNGGRISFFTE